MKSDFSMSGLRRMEAPGNIRAGDPTRGSRASIFADEESDVSMDMPRAVVILARRGDKFLAVSRGPDMSDMNLPGGEVELSEEPADAAKRELYEETGLKARHLIPVYTAPGDNGFIVTVYMMEEWDGKLTSSKEGYPDWVEADELLESRYGDFFREMAKKLMIELLSGCDDMMWV